MGGRNFSKSVYKIVTCPLSYEKHIVFFNNSCFFNTISSDSFNAIKKTCAFFVLKEHMTIYRLSWKNLEENFVLLKMSNFS